MTDTKSPTTTLADLPSVGRVKRARTGRRIFLAFIVILVLLGLGERLGVRSATVTTHAGSYNLRVTYAAMTRPGLDTPFNVEVTRPTSLPAEVTVGVELDYLNLFDKNGGLDPDPTQSTSDGRFVYWTFSTSGQSRLRISLDAILAMGQQWGRSGTVVLMVKHEVIATAKFHTWVAP
jgi:hypothetical protein